MGKMKLRGHPSAQCHVMFYIDGSIDLVSYETTVMEYNPTSDTLHCSGLYSMTTRKHISWFLKEYFPKIRFQDVKTALETNNGIINLKEGMYHVT